MAEVTRFGLAVGVVALALYVAVLSNRLSAWIRVPAPALFLVAAAAVAYVATPLSALPVVIVQRVVTVALIIILFDGGMGLGWRRFRAGAVPIALLGVVGTVLTTAAIALFAGTLLGFPWRAAVLLGAALAPTDPAVVFSVLGRREISGRSGAILEGESGVNDPVGIAVMISLLAATGAGRGLLEFTVEMAVGLVVGLLGGWVLLVFIRRFPLPSEGLYPVRLLAGAGVLYGLAAVVHGSGFLAVFVAGILLGDARGPYQPESKQFLSALGHLGEIVAFVYLGLTVSLRSLPPAWAVGLLLAVVLTLVIRPVVIGALLLPARLRTGERLFIAWCGLKGAVPILLGTFLLTSAVPDASRLYHIIVVVVTFSVVVQGGLVPAVARWCRVPMRDRGRGYSPDETVPSGEDE